MEIKMITKNDCILLLTDIAQKGIDTKNQLKELLASPTLPLSIIKFINDNRQLDLIVFYEGIRKSYNQKKSTLYINIVKEVEDPTEVLTTLSAMLTQILRFSKKVDNKTMFLKHSRASDITKVLNNYFNTYDITLCQKLLRIIKADIKALESIK
jgi:hypothetical protein